MKKPLFQLSIKLRVTLWYTLFVLAITCITLFGIMHLLQQATNRHMEDLLLVAMSDASDAVTNDTRPRLDTFEVAEHSNVSFSLYDANGTLWQGRSPRFSLPFSDGEVRQAALTTGASVLTQDMLIPLSGGSVWLRGVISLDTALFMQDETILLFFYFLPLLLLLSTVGGYLLTRRALLPIKRMARKAEQVTLGTDLSARFDEAAKRDELGELARTFNNMFERLERSFERETRFTSDAAHELRTPVAIVRACAENALKAGDAADMRDALQAIESKSVQMGDMLSQMLALARLEAGRATITRESVCLDELCRVVADEIGERAKQKNITIDLSAVRPDVCVMGDELLLMRVLMNLTDNAVKFSNEGGKIWLSLTDEGTSVTLTVRDEGRGMDEETCRRAFARFYQADAARAGSGAGLGLNMAQLIARLHGGDIEAQSKIGHGTSMIVTLPK